MSYITKKPALPALSVGLTGYKQPVSARGHLTADNTDSTITSITYSQFFPLTDPTIDRVLPLFTNQFVGTSGGAVDAEAPNTLTIAAAVVHSDGTIIPFQFGGQHTATVPRDGTPVIPDAPVVFGAQVAGNAFNTNAALGLNGVVIRTYVTVPAARSETVGTTSGSNTVSDPSITLADTGRPVSGTGIPTAAYIGNVVAGTSFQMFTTSTTVNPVAANATATASITATIKSVVPLGLGTYSNADKTTSTSGADLTLAGSGAITGGASPAYFYGPSLILGAGTSKRLVGALTDSIFDGYSETFASAYYGPVARACGALNLGLVKLSRGGQSTTQPGAASTRRMYRQFVPGCTDFIIELGTNDGILTNGAGVTQMQDRLISLVYWLKGEGVARVHVATVPPRTTSTDAWATTGNQTTTTGSTVGPLAALNDWLRAVPAPIFGVIDLADDCMSARNSGVWVAGGTSDGVHPSTALLTGAITTRVQSYLAALPAL